MAVEIIKVRCARERREFLNFPLRLYKKEENFVPPLYGDEKKIFSKKNVYARVTDSEFFLAVRDGETVGRIQGIIQRQYNEIHGERKARFTRFDSIDDPEISSLLFAAVEDWARGLGMTELVGPLGYSDLEREGLLIEGFEYLATFEEQYNYPYYASLVEKAGFEKDVDWLEHRMFSLTDDREMMERVLERALKRYNLHYADKSLGKRAFLKKYADGMFDCVDECYKELYGTVPFTPEMRRDTLSQFSLVLDLKYIEVICDENEEVVAFGLCLPGLGEAVRRSGGRLTPLCIMRILHAVKKPTSVDFALIGIMPKYRSTGLIVFMETVLDNILALPSVKYLETNLNLEDNQAIMANWKYFDHIQHKRRRAYKKAL